MSSEETYPKERIGDVCGMFDCIYHESYVRWDCNDRNINFCMECKHAHVSQYEARVE